MQTAPVLAVLVCHDGETWLPRVLNALRDSSVRPQLVVAVDTGSRDKTPALLAAASGEGGVIDAVLTLPRGSGYAEAVARGVDHADTALGQDPDWLWLLHDDSAPEEDCLAALLNTAEAAPSAGALGPLAVDWGDPQLIVDAGLSLDASGHLRGGMGLDNSEHVEQSTEVLAMPSAGMLVRRSVYDNLDGFDEAFQVFAEDVDFGWRVNVSGRTVVCVPRARIRHVRALTDGARPAAALTDAAPAIDSVAAARRLGGLRTFLVNCSQLSYRIGVPRLVTLCLLRGMAYFVIKDMSRSRVEFAAVRYLLGGSADLRAGRERRAQERVVAAAAGNRKTSVRGLFVGRFTRLRFALHQLVLVMVRRRMASEVALGRLPDTAQARPTTWVPADELRAATFAGGRTRDVVAVPLDELPAPVPAKEATGRAPALPRPSPGVAAAQGGLVFVEVDRKRILAATLFAPPLVLGLVMVALALAVNWQRLGLDLTGGRLLPVAGLGEVWSAYLASWHSTGGGTTAQVPAALAVIGALGAPLASFGGPAAAVALLFFADIPVAALSAYAATRRMRVQRWVRALLAAVYALLPAGTAAVAQGRVDVVVAHMVLPLICTGVAGVLAPRKGGERWLPTAVQTALGLTLLGAFSPLGHVLVLAGLLLGFVFVHSDVSLGRRVAGMAVVVLLPIGLLAPWLITLAGAGRALLLHGIGARLPEVAVTSGELALLHPGGVGAIPVGGGLLLVAALVSLVVRPTWRAATGCGIVLIGAAGVAAVLILPVAPVGGGAPRHGWAGVPLLVVGIGLLAILLAVAQRDRASRPRGPAGSAGLGGRIAVGLGVGGLIVFMVSALIAGREGPLRSADTVRLAAPIAAELARTGESVLVLATDGDPPRVRAGRMPSFGDDDLPLPAGSVQRLYGWQNVFLTAPGPANAVRDTVAAVSASGVRFLVLPHGYVPDGILEAGGELVTTAPPLSDGRQVVRLRPTGGPVVLIAPELSERAIGGKPPIGDIEGEGIAVVDAQLPDVRLRVSDGPGGRLLVLAATFQPGWRATVNGQPADIVPAWGHQVAVEMPTRAAEVVVDVPQPVRTMLLLVQIGGLLFTALTALPARRPRTAANR